jgi:hypothetical protein
MVIQLTNPWQAGSIDDQATYPQAKIVGVFIGIEKDRAIRLVVEFGDTDPEDGWIPGKNGRFKITLSDDSYVDFLVTHAATLQALQLALYQTTQSLYPIKAAGEIV